MINDERDLQSLIPFEEQPLIIGGGSNILLTKDLKNPVIINEIKGKEIVQVDIESVVVKLGGGEVWHDAVLWALENNLGGIENLSLIPGKCGAAPMQNIGAYGVELSGVFERLDAIELATGKKRYFEKAECRFGYRDSVFKNELKDKYFIEHLYLRLTLPEHHTLVLSYGKVKKALKEQNIFTPTIQDVSKTIIEIRKSKLPSPAEIPNCGSFFKNPIIGLKQFEQLKSKHPKIPSYKNAEMEVKIPAGWLIEECGWKGKRNGPVGCHKDHALVICNYGASHGWQIERFYQKIIISVSKKFGIVLEPEVNIW
jgi:UDP-N-acetylmuramate dehydrogenase